MDSTTTSTSYTINYGDEIKYGWVCPLCGRANAPWMNQCPCRVLKTWNLTNSDLSDVTYINTERND